MSSNAAKNTLSNKLTTQKRPKLVITSLSNKTANTNNNSVSNPWKRSEVNPFQPGSIIDEIENQDKTTKCLPASDQVNETKPIQVTPAVQRPVVPLILAQHENPDPDEDNVDHDIFEPAIVRMNRRLQWNKFGDEAGKSKRGGTYNPHANIDNKTGQILTLQPLKHSETAQIVQLSDSVTVFGPEFQLRLYAHIKGADISDNATPTTNSLALVTCKTCANSGHFTRNCPEKSQKPNNNAINVSDNWTEAQHQYYARNSEKQIIIRNLPLEIQKFDVEELCSRFGRIMRICLPNPKKELHSYSWNSATVYVEFQSSLSAQNARARLDKHLYDNQVLSVALGSDKYKQAGTAAERQRNNTGGGKSAGAEEEQGFVLVR
jgi:hypothetical protein